MIKKKGEPIEKKNKFNRWTDKYLPRVYSDFKSQCFLNLDISPATRCPKRCIDHLVAQKHEAGTGYYGLGYLQWGLNKGAIIHCYC